MQNHVGRGKVGDEEVRIDVYALFAIEEDVLDLAISDYDCTTDALPADTKRILLGLTLYRCIQLKFMNRF